MTGHRGRSLKSEYLKRFLLCFLALFAAGLGNTLGVLAGGAGTNAWNTLNNGLSSMLGLSFGTANLMISFVLIIIAILGKGKIGFGTILNIAVVPVASDLFISWFSFIPQAASLPLGVFYTLLGQMILSFTTVGYMYAALGCGPRDTLLVLTGKCFPKLPIGAVKFGLELAVLAAGVLIGAPFGPGTVLVMALQAGMFQLACRICRFEPRNVKHEGFSDTLARLRRQNKEE